MQGSRSNSCGFQKKGVGNRKLTTGIKRDEEKGYVRRDESEGESQRKSRMMLRMIVWIFDIGSLFSFLFPSASSSPSIKYHSGLCSPLSV